MSTVVGKRVNASNGLFGARLWKRRRLASTPVSQDDDRIAALEREAAAGWGRYHELRRRRAVRAALALANAGARVLGRRPPTVAAPPPAATPTPPQEQVAHPWPLGHFYSPVPDTVALAREPESSRVWPAAAPELPGIDWREDAQVALMRELLALPPLAFPSGPTGEPTEYHTGNEQFSAVDAWALQAMLRHLRPRRLIEVGSGWSSLVAARVNREHLGGATDITCIEPYVPEQLAGGVDGIARMLAQRVQDVPLATFAELDAGDVLFIDSSHVVKAGSDAQMLYHDILPRLRHGVVVHVHDIFLPRDYPRDWVLGGRGWNEQYVLRAFLAFNDAFEVLLGMAWLAEAHPELLAQAVPDFRRAGGGSFWMRRSR
jgi:hypothetical protein